MPARESVRIQPEIQPPLELQQPMQPLEPALPQVRAPMPAMALEPPPQKRLQVQMKARGPPSGQQGPPRLEPVLPGQLLPPPEREPLVEQRQERAQEPALLEQPVALEPLEPERIERRQEREPPPKEPIVPVGEPGSTGR